MALSVLVVDPNEEWLQSAATYLKENLYNIKTVTNGKDAQLALYNDKFFAVVINWATKNHSCGQVLKFIKTNHPSQKVVVIVDDPELFDSVEAAEERLKKLGASEVAIKPFEMSVVKVLLEGHQGLGDFLGNLPKRKGQSAEEEVDVKDDQFSQVRIGEFYSAPSVMFDIYVKLKDNHYVKILHAGDEFSKERIDTYKEKKKVEFLYFHKSDMRKFVQYNNHLAKKLINNERVPLDSKVKQLKNVTAQYVDQLFTEGVKPQVIEQGREVCENMYQLVEKQEDLYKLLRSYQDFDPNAFTHAFLVSMFSTAIIKQFDWQSKTTIETTAMACLFHDIGKLKLPPEFKGLRPADMTDEQLELYKTHPDLGVEVVEGNRTINNSIKQIILQHHEAYDGSGYPFGKKGSKILTLANIVCLADDFTHIMVDENLEPVMALRKMLSNQEQVKRYNSMIVQNFINVFVDPGKIVKEAKQLAVGTKVISRKAS